ncbi:MAG: efflux RND transporter periplasmic adaptor subunit [Pseudomonas sp.]|uniref:efflux RND transporter periplasmic adaptor subunit n=1 Tax=Pseudomonas sp. TaxID=306 RepID=UPI0027345F28|nr:efflux RND transporter periplasmic adaptor subunit [Pseudomonas sp.]MDP3845280.1 efflux RND transporter periplasmic adaptor subunit [Pseudomonas sp.]
MNRSGYQTPLLMTLLLLGGATAGYWLAAQNQAIPATTGAPASSPSTQAERQVLYWYDPMYPQQHFPAPGKSPFMDMQLVPRYAEQAAANTAGAVAAEPSMQVAPGTQQNLGMRLATVTRGPLAQSLQASAVLAFNERDVALLQTRAGGFVERTYQHAPGDLVVAGAPLAELLIPEWVAAQTEFLALRPSLEPELLAAARQRLRLLGMPADLITQVERSGRAQPLTILRSPIAGVITELNARSGMTLAAGTTLARINGLDPVWLELALPEAQAGAVQLGQAAEAQLPAFPGERLTGTVASVLPAADAQSRTLRVRVELANPSGRLRPGMSAQVQLNLPSSAAVLLLPSEAVIRTGKRALVMLAEAGGRFRPVQVQLGAESAGQVAVLAGLQEGQQVVASGQFLLDSEASLTGLQATPLPAAPLPTAHSPLPIQPLPTPHSPLSTPHSTTQPEERQP